MKATYISVHKILGARKLPPGVEVLELVDFPERDAKTKLVADPEPYLTHLNRYLALFYLRLSGNDDASSREILPQTIADIKAKRAADVSDGVFLVFEGEKHIPNPDFSIRHDTDDYALCFDAVSKPEIKQYFHAHVQSTIAALRLGLGDVVESNIQKIAEFVYLWDEVANKPIYTSSPEMGAPQVSQSVTLEPRAVAEAAALIPRLISDEGLRRTIRLLIASFEKTTGELAAFMSAWAALETFVNSKFSAQYRAAFQTTEATALGWSEDFFRELRAREGSNFTLVERFRVVASVLAPGEAAQDQTEFEKIKKLRDHYTHGRELPDAPWPTVTIQNLLMKYLKMHLNLSSESLPHTA